ncbi:S1 family peptidase [Alteribacillus sp. JSM 102045]|uniref:S1 family peptidase n=1 Tax=Alteribacillus sp. JSM 102045 TaxID=1562101 RepID=UPI0035C0CDE5
MNDNTEETIKSLLEFENIEVHEAGEINFLSRTDYTCPLHGGLGIWKSGSSQDFDCTTAYPAKNTKGQYFMVTAGHCSDPSVGWAQGGEYIGNMSTVHWQFGDEVDAGGIYIGDSSSAATSEIYGSSYNLTNLEKWENEKLGQMVCKSGGNSGITCGTLQDNRVSFYYEGMLFKNFRGTDVYARNQDSGGTVYRGEALLGTVSAEFGEYSMIYSHARNAYEDIGLEPYFTFN